jgi:hypothetical protein
MKTPESWKLTGFSAKPIPGPSMHAKISSTTAKAAAPAENTPAVSAICQARRLEPWLT